jgi:hypothetical protein
MWNHSGVSLDELSETTNLVSRSLIDQTTAVPLLRACLVNVYIVKETRKVKNVGSLLYVTTVLFPLAVGSPTYPTAHTCCGLTSGNYKGRWSDALMVLHYSRIYLKVLRETTRSLIQNIRYPNRGFYPDPTAERSRSASIHSGTQPVGQKRRRLVTNW